MTLQEFKDKCGTQKLPRLVGPKCDYCPTILGTLVIHPKYKDNHKVQNVYPRTGKDGLYYQLTNIKEKGFV